MRVSRFAPGFRGTELGLLLMAGLLTAAMLGALALGGHQPLGSRAFGPIVLVGATFLVLHLATSLFCPRADQTLLPIGGLLTAMGLAVIGRVAPELLDRQGLWVAIAGVPALLAIVWPGLPGIFQRYRYTSVIAGLGLLAATFVLGVDPNNSGARLWLSFGSVFFQPSEILKVILVGFLASYLAEKRELITFGGYRYRRLTLPPLPYLIPLAVFIGSSLLLLLVQRDLGAALLFFGVSLAMLYAASGRSSYLLAGAALFAVGAFAAYRLFSVAQRRIDVWLNPWSDPQDASFQIVQSLLAFASGGLAGTGLGWGAPRLIPAAQTDFPFAVIGEQLGLFGTLAVLAVFLLLVGRALGIALAFGTTRAFETLLALGLACTLGLQSLIILGGNLALLPLTGITLPFVSYGGSSLLTNYLILGLLIQLSHQAAHARQ